jgi:predicted DNA-binding protein (MmcQ/YjbR family)
MATMNLEDIRAHCIAKEHVEECFPFDEDTLVFKVNGKMFLLMGLTDHPLQINVKCDPERALLLRDEYTNVLPGYHMNKKHWNTIVINNVMSRKMIMEQIDHSYDLVKGGNSKRKKEK